MTPDEMNPNICPSALNEDGLNIFADDESGGRHKWDTTTDPQTCAECGTERDTPTPLDVIAFLNNQILHTDGDDYEALQAYKMCAAAIKQVHNL